MTTARILDTIPAFEKFARKAGLESPFLREQLWAEIYQSAHPEVFQAFFDEQGGREGMHAVVRELSKVRLRVKEASPVMADLINSVEPAVMEALGMPAEEGPDEPIPGDLTGKAPLHVLMVGTFSTNGFVGKLGDEVAVFHCLEWFSGAEPTRVLIAHEDTHAWHNIAMQRRYESGGERDMTLPGDPAWTAFYEGLAIHVSRKVVPGRPEDDYFWYGVAGFEDWLEECKKDEATLLKKFKQSLDKDEATDAFFGGGFVEKKWRTGYYLADLLVGRLNLSPNRLASMTVEEARGAIKDSL